MFPKIGLIGLGYLGSIHLKLLSSIESVDFAGIYDLDSNLLKVKSNEFKLSKFESIDELIYTCDAIVIVSPTKTHFEIAKKCIESGKHIFIEKPATSTLDEAKLLLSLLKNKSIVTQIGHVERFNPVYLELQKKNLPIKLIHATRLAPFTPRGADVSVVMDVMIHDLDLILGMVDSEVKSVVAHGSKMVTMDWDIATAKIEFKNGIIANVTASRNAEKKVRQFQIESDKFYDGDLMEKTIKVYPQTPSMNEFDMNNHSQIIQTEPNNAILEELKYWLKCIENNKKSVISLLEGYNAIKLACEIEQILNQNEK